MQMNRYRIFGGIAQIGAAAVLALDAEQIAARKHNLELPENYDRKKHEAGKLVVVKANVPLQFKVGEVLGMENLPQHLIGIAEPIDGIKSPVDEKAADKAMQIKNPEGHAARTAARKKQAAEAKAAAAKAKK